MNKQYTKQIKEHHVGFNDDINKEYKLFGFDNTKRLHWDIITMCNYHCTYCYSRASEHQWNKITSTKQIDEIISKFKQINNPLEIIVLGGEPTMHPKYFYIMDEIYALEDHLMVMGNITNGTFKNYKEFINKHEKYKDKFHWNVTFHPSEIKDFQAFKDVIQYIQNSGFKINVNIMLVDTNYKEQTEDMLDYCTEHKFRYYFNVVFNHGGQEYMNYNKDYAEWMRSLSEKYGGIKELVYFKDDEIIGKFNDIDVYLNNFSDFLGWKCKNNNFQISVGGTDFSKFCSFEKMTVQEINEEDEYMICPLKQCVCQGKLTNEKLPQTN